MDSVRLRLRWLFLLICILFVLILYKLFIWQIASSDTLTGLAEKQRMNSSVKLARRGSILSSDRSPLVMNQRAYLVYAEPKNIQEYKKTSEVLANELGDNDATIAALVARPDLDWVPIHHKADEAIVENIKKHNLPGIGFIEESKRYYPEGSMAAHLLGFVGKNSKGEDYGYFGLEGYYNEQLRGRDGVARQESDALGFPILFGNRDEVPSDNGRDLVLTIDKTMQYIAEQQLKDGIERFGAKGGTVSILDPQTGAIAAMASFPSYDPAAYASFPEEFYKNPVIGSTYEPGSTFKVLVMAAALNSGKLRPDVLYHEDGPVTIGGYTIKTWNQQYHGEISLPQILQYSSNVGMVFVGKTLGNDLLLSNIETLRFGQPTEIDLQDESTIALRDKNAWYEIDYATASFGQGIAVTPIQMLRAVAAIANGGKLLRPYVVQKIVTKEGTIDTPVNVEADVFSKETTAMVTAMMHKAVDVGETKYLKTTKYKIAGKTGTAQIPIAGHYDTSKTIASFVGFAPYDNPKYVMLVTIHEPTSSPWGSETAAPLFFSISKELFRYYGITPS